ncbi:MAG TPA: hypothetical protein VJ254_24115, partial [Streptosporangiaceae bacterium]|nr:hypothetical protein [Streptosporangiaceae bacterium]
VMGIGVPPHGRAPCPVTRRHTPPGITPASRAALSRARSGARRRAKGQVACWRLGSPGGTM